MPASDSFQWFVFVDFENVPQLDLERVEGKSAHVTILIGKNQRKLEVGLVRQIHRRARQVELVEVGASGRNALDLTLAFYLGQGVQRTPAAQFCIVSGDKDFDPMIAHLQGAGIKVERCGEFARLPFLSAVRRASPARSDAPRKAPVARSRPVAATGKAPVDRRTKVVGKLKDPANRHRPATEKALRAHLKHALGRKASPEEVEDVFRELCAGSHLVIDPRGRVVYGAV